MSSSNIEYLADRRRKEAGDSKSLRALRHLDAAHAKLEKLQVWRKQLKQDYELRVDERDTALVALENTLEQLEEKSRALDEALILVGTQEDLIVQLLDELADKEDAVQAQAQQVSAPDDRPALTARVLAKVSEPPLLSNE